MKKYFLSLVTSSFILSIAFLQCAPSGTNNSQVTTQKDTVISKKATESIPVAEPIPVDEPKTVAKPKPLDEPKTVAKLTPIEEPKAVAEPKSIDEPKTVAKPTPVDEPKTVAKPTPVDEPNPVAKTTPIDKPKNINEPTPIAKPTPVDEPASLMSSRFTLKLLKGTIKGTSTLHDWESQVTEVEGKGLFQIKDKLLTTIQDAEIKIAVTGIISKEGKKMDNKTYETFKSDENPFIVYSFSTAAVKISASQVVTVDATGKLTMAGTSKPVSVSAKGKELPNGDLQLTVSRKIKMTDYNMEPPVMLLGTIKVGDEITVSFDFELTKVKE